MIRLAPDRLAYPARASARLLAPDRGGGAMGTGRPHRIQIVEDDYFIGMQIEDALAAAGYEIVGIAPRSTMKWKNFFAWPCSSAT